VHPGQRIGKYVLGDRIAVGGMAEVWAARAEGPEGFIKPVALKFILESFSGDPELEQLFVKEARIAAQLQHANLVAVFDFDKVILDPLSSAPARYYIAMEHVEGHDARRVAEAAKHAGYLFPVPVALYLAGEVCKGLRYVHERRDKGRLLGLVHRDVSPHNVLVGFSGEVKLSDFGIAKSLAHSTRTKTGTVRGKLSYASPEQLNGEAVDHRTDQFALGITLWELLAGRPLFDGNDEVEIAGKVMRCDVPPLGLVSAERKIPPAVEGFVRRLLSPRRDERYATTADALSALLALPAYSGDGVSLGDLVRTLFHRSSVGPVSTMSLPAPAKPAPVRRGGGVARGGDQAPSDVETRTMARGAAAAAGAAGIPHVTTVRVRGGEGQGGGRSRAKIAALAAGGGLALIGVAVGAVYLSTGHAADPVSAAATANATASASAEDETSSNAPVAVPASPTPTLATATMPAAAQAVVAPAREEREARGAVVDPAAAARAVAASLRAVAPIVTLPATPAPALFPASPTPAPAEAPPASTEPPPAAPTPPAASKPRGPANGAPIVE
jgi:serine/threonine protein kinase